MIRRFNWRSLSSASIKFAGGGKAAFTLFFYEFGKGGIAFGALLGINYRKIRKLLESLQGCVYRVDGWVLKENLTKL
jgi:hypothetical protein